MRDLARFTTRLERAGAKLETVIEYGLSPAAEHAEEQGQPLDAWCTPVVEYALALHGQGRELWSPLRFVVGHLARISGADASAFAGLLRTVATLLLELDLHETSTTRTEQYGLHVAAAAVSQSAPFAQCLDFALSIARRGGDPGWFLQLTVPALWGTAKDRAAFEQRLEVLERFVLRLLAVDHSAGYPVATGLAALATHAQGIDTHWPRWLAPLERLAVSLGRQAYAAFEYGLTGLAQSGLSADELVASLEVALTLADHGLDPTATLQRGFDSPQAIDLARRLARSGIEPFYVLTGGLPAFRALGLMHDDGERLAALAEALHAQGLSNRRLFEDGLRLVPELEQHEAGLGLVGLELAEAMVRRGLEPGVVFAYGLPRALGTASRFPFVARQSLEFARTLAAAGIDPEPALAYAVRPLAELADGDEQQFQRLRAAVQDLVLTMQRLGVDHREVLFHDVSSLAEAGAHSTAFIELLERVHLVLEVWLQEGLDPTRLLSAGIPTAARGAVGRPWVLAAALDSVLRLAREHRGEEALQLLEVGLGAASQTAGADEVVFRRTLAHLEARCAQLPADLLGQASVAACGLAGTDVEALDAALSVIGTHFEARLGPTRSSVIDALPGLVRLADGAPALGSLIDALFEVLEQVPEGLRAAWLSRGLPAAAVVCRGSPKDGAAFLRALAVASSRWGDAAAWLLSSVVLELAPVAVGDAAGLLELVDAVAAVGARLENRQDAASVVAVAGQAHDVRSAAERTRLLGEVLASTPQRGALIEGLARLRPMLRSSALWAKVVVPALTAHRHRAGPLLTACSALGPRALERDESLDVLRELLTQLGVRALDVLTSLVLPAVHRGVIGHLEEHRAFLQDYLRDVSFHDARVYERYLELRRDPALSEPARRAQIQALRDDVSTLTEAIRGGEVSPGQERSPLFFVALQHVFPPSVSATRQTYERLYHELADRPVDLAARPLPEALRRWQTSVASGSWQLREGGQVDRGPWAPVARAVELAANEALSSDAAVLGWDLLNGWTEGRVGREGVKEELLARLLRRAGESAGVVSAATETAAQLLALKDLASDRVFELLEECLLAARGDDAGRYERLVRGKLAPPPRVGAGLIKSVWKTVEARRSGAIDDAAAKARLSGQLQAFELDEQRVREVLAAVDSTGVAGCLGALPPKGVVVEPGKEVQRLHADLIGQELNAMQRVLFGGDGVVGCLELRASSDEQALVVEVTKRRAHAVVGLTEGVCVAHDVQLWNTSTFFQIVLWGSSGTCVGGMHALIVEEPDGGYLALPGINPTLALLELVDASVLLQTLMRYAWELAHAWGLRGVWVPTHPGIRSNRRVVNEVLEARGWPVRATRDHPFSFSPYAYRFAEVYEVPAPTSPQSSA